MSGERTVAQLHDEVLDWIRRIIGPDTATRSRLDNLESEVASLSTDVDQLAFERDDLTELLDRDKQRTKDLRDHAKGLRAAALDAYEPVQVGDCRKLRFLHREDAEQNAIKIAAKLAGDTFNVYQCKRCPVYPGFDVRPWHVGHCRDLDDGSMRVVSGVLHHACGCAFSVRSGETVWACPDHGSGGAA